MSGARRLLFWLDRNLERRLLLFLYVYIVAVVFIEVARRFVFSYSSVWGEETARYAFVYLVWIGAAAAARERAHIRIDVVPQMLPPRGRAVLSLFGDAAAFAFGLFALYHSAESVWSSVRFDSLTSGLRINIAWFTFAVPFGFFLILIRLAQSAREDVADLLAGRPPRKRRALFSDDADK